MYEYDSVERDSGLEYHTYEGENSTYFFKELTDFSFPKVQVMLKEVQRLEFVDYNGYGTEDYSFFPDKNLLINSQLDDDMSYVTLSSESSVVNDIQEDYLKHLKGSPEISRLFDIQMDSGEKLSDHSEIISYLTFAEENQTNDFFMNDRIVNEETAEVFYFPEVSQFNDAQQDDDLTYTKKLNLTVPDIDMEYMDYIDNDIELSELMDSPKAENDKETLDIVKNNATLQTLSDSDENLTILAGKPKKMAPESEIVQIMMKRTVYPLSIFPLEPEKQTGDKPQQETNQLRA